MFSGDVLAPVVTALQETITVTDVISLFASGVKVALPLILNFTRLFALSPELGD